MTTYSQQVRDQKRKDTDTLVGWLSRHLPHVVLLVLSLAAVIPLLDALLRGNMREVAERLQMQLPANEKDGGAVGRERIAAAELRSKIRNRRQQDVPESVRIAVSAYSQLVGIFSCILGFNANLLSRADYERRYLTGTHPDPIAISPNWLIRTAFALAPANRRK